MASKSFSVHHAVFSGARWDHLQVPQVPHLEVAAWQSFWLRMGEEMGIEDAVALKLYEEMGEGKGKARDVPTTERSRAE